MIEKLEDCGIPYAPWAKTPHFFSEDTKNLLAEIVKPEHVVLELGTFLGGSTAFLAERCKAVYTVDHFEGSRDLPREWIEKEFPRGLYRAFCENMQDELRPKIRVVRGTTIEGMLHVWEASISPDVIFVDASHEYHDVRADLSLALSLFGGYAHIVMDDYDWQNPNEELLPTVQMAILDLQGSRGFRMEPRGNAALIYPMLEEKC